MPPFQDGVAALGLGFGLAGVEVGTNRASSAQVAPGPKATSRWQAGQVNRTRGTEATVPATWSKAVRQAVQRTR